MIKFGAGLLRPYDHALKRETQLPISADEAIECTWDFRLWPFSALQLQRKVRFAPGAALPAKSHFDPTRTSGRTCAALLCATLALV